MLSEFGESIVCYSKVINNISKKNHKNMQNNYFQDTVVVYPAGEHV